MSAGGGIGATRLAAFDAALRAAGVGNFNLVKISSVIPAGASVREVPGSEQITGEYGDLLYCVYADAYTSTPGEQAWAGLAWGRQHRPAGPGLFVEHVGNSRAAVAHDLAASLRAVAEGRSWPAPALTAAYASAHCEDHPVCAVVVATYRRTSWVSEDA